MVDDAALEDFSGLTDFKEEERNAVVVGLAPNMFNYGQLNKAFRCVGLKNSNIILLTSDVTFLLDLYIFLKIQNP
jgi:hypothetical protein